MINKVLGRMEALKGFVQIPVKDRGELIGDLPTPCKTLVNGEPARLDNYGRLWSPSLRGKFSAGSLVQVSKAERGYKVELAVAKGVDTVSTVKQTKEMEPNIASPTIVQSKKSDAEILSPLTTQNIRGERQVLFRQLVQDIPSTTYATFGLYRYPAKFIPQVIAYVLKTYASPGMSIFDPFAGYGTVGIVARVYGYDYELWDLNPLIETLHAVATLKPEMVNVTSLLHQMGSSTEEFIPQWSRLHYWFPQEFLPFLFKVWGFYHSLDDDYLKLLLTIPLLKTTRYFSYDDQQRQKLSKSPKSERRINLLLASDWRTKFFQMAEEEIREVLKGIQEYWKLNPKNTNAIIKGGIDTLSMDLKEEKDILITSPPYLQSQEYIRQAKMDLFWLGHSEKKIREVSRLEIPYRDVKPQPIHSDTFLQWSNEIEEPHLRKVFNRYFWGVLGALTRLQEKIGSYIFLFVGRASMRGRPVPIDQIFAEHFTSLGWIHEATLIDTIVARRMFSYRINPATGLKDRRTPTENLVILRRKPQIS